SPAALQMVAGDFDVREQAVLRGHVDAVALARCVAHHVLDAVELHAPTSEHAAQARVQAHAVENVVDVVPADPDIDQRLAAVAPHALVLAGLDAVADDLEAGDLHVLQSADQLEAQAVHARAGAHQLGAVALQPPAHAVLD